MVLGAVKLPPREELLRRFQAKEPGHDGAFVVGVLSTGIYCLPSCPAKLPRPENVRFFADEDGAREAGLRACKRCRPDDFYRGYDPDRELAQELAERVRAEPAAFPDVAALVRTAGVGKTKLVELFRRHWHASPADFLVAARVARAARALEAGRVKALDAGLDAGFESSSAFHENFRRAMGTAPGAYARLVREAARELALELPDPFRTEGVLAMFGRDAEGICERVHGRKAAKALTLDGRAFRLELSFTRRRVAVRLVGRSRPSRRAVVQAHATVRRLLGLGQDPAPFERRAARLSGLGPLRAAVRARAGLRIPQTTDLFEGLAWVVVGQQVNLTFASLCRSRLIALCGADAGDGFRAHPTPAEVAALDEEDLTALQFSGRKAQYLLGAARALVAGELDAERLARLPADLLDQELRAVRGLGPWSAQYLLMRSFGLADCVPVGDAGLVAALQRTYDLDERPDARETLRLMEPFAPYRSLACCHLWKSLGDDA